MKLILRISTIPLMITFLQDLKEGKASTDQLADLFHHPDYLFEFSRYGVPVDDTIIEYFFRLNRMNEANIPELSSERKNMLKDKHQLWLRAYENPQKYRVLYDDIMGFATEENIQAVIKRCKNGLPNGVDLGDVNIISTMSIGMSFGYVFDNALHFDMMQLNDIADLLPLIAHETHHLAMWRFVSTFIDELTLEERYIFSFSGEGLAIKFCNNAQGRFSKAIDSGAPVNEGLDAFSMDYLNSRFDQDWVIFEQTLADIHTGKMTKDDVFEQLNAYWWNPYTEEQSKGDRPLLKQSKMYTFGNDLYGSIYDAFGKEALFDCIRHPRKAVECFRSIHKV